jgi:O-antigen ligase
MLLIASKPLAIWFGVTGDNESGSVLDRLVLLGLAVAGMVVLGRRRFDWSRALRRHGWLLVLLVYMLVSTLWSDITFIALKRWIREGIVVIMALVILSEANPRQALESILRRSAYILIPFSLMLIKYYPALGASYGRWSGTQMWIGVTVHKNTLGHLCLISAFFLFWALYRRWREPAQAGGRIQGWADVSVFLITLVLFKGADNAFSATSVGTFAVGIATCLGLLWLRKLRLKVPQPALLLLVILFIVFGASAPFLGGSNLRPFNSTFGRDETLTGRTEVWQALVPLAMGQPVFGYGFGSFWTTARQDLYEINYAHNGYLDILLTLGAVGLAFYTFWLLSCVRKLHGALAQDYDWACLAICFLVMAVVYNATESALDSLAGFMTAVPVLASFVASSRMIPASR